MDYLISAMGGILVGALFANLSWKWKLLDKVRTGQRLELDGELFEVRRDDDAR